MGVNQRKSFYYFFYVFFSDTNREMMNKTRVFSFSFCFRIPTEREIYIINSSDKKNDIVKEDISSHLKSTYASSVYFLFNLFLNRNKRIQKSGKQQPTKILLKDKN